MEVICSLLAQDVTQGPNIIGVISSLKTDTLPISPSCSMFLEIQADAWHEGEPFSIDIALLDPDMKRSNLTALPPKSVKIFDGPLPTKVMAIPLSFGIAKYGWHIIRIEINGIKMREIQLEVKRPG